MEAEMPGWNVENAAGSVGLGAVTLLNGTSFCISAASGDMIPSGTHGMFIHDTRFISEWKLVVNGQLVEPLSATTPDPNRASFVGRAHRSAREADAGLLIERERILSDGITETVLIHNYSQLVAECTVELVVDTDFADIFEVKENRLGRRWKQTRQYDGRYLILDGVWRRRHQRVAISFEQARSQGRNLVTQVAIPPHAEHEWHISMTPLSVAASLTQVGDKILIQEESLRRITQWRAAMPIADLGNDAVEKVIRCSQEDLGSLRIFHPDHPGRTVVAAGSPWFMALFGRDSLLAAFMSLLLDPSLALGTLKTLADYQGKEVNPDTEEEPGRILHEVRLGVSSGLILGGRGIYYGTADATPLFVIVLAELSRWGLEPDTVRSLLPAADRALAWIENFGDRDGDGFVEYQRSTDRGLVNQGWKDSWDGISFADGTLAEAPLALCEVQGYVYAAYIGRAAIALTYGDRETADRCTAQAAKIKEAFNERFWLPDRGYFALALDRDKKPVDALASNMGHCLWTGIVDDDKAAQVAEHLMSPQMFTGWGIRTLASSMGAYNPASYHNGSVWPHDSTIIASGLMRYGFSEEAQKVAYGLFEAADSFGGRLPELFCGLDRISHPVPVPYPSSCSPQAWAAAAPVQLIRILMSFHPALLWNELWIGPALPPRSHFHLDNVPFAGLARLSIDIDTDNNSVVVEGLPDHVKLHVARRPPLDELSRLTRRSPDRQDE
jgi:glycogen debranching enzyme